MCEPADVLAALRLWGESGAHRHPNADGQGSHSQRQAFTKTWRVKNVGTCTWTADYKAAYSRGDALGAPAFFVLQSAA